MEEDDSKYYERDASYVLDDGSDGMDDDACGELMKVSEYKRRVLARELEPPDEGTGMYLYWWIKLPESERAEILAKPKVKKQLPPAQFRSIAYLDVF
jgi:hypothetical protein